MNTKTLVDGIDLGAQELDPYLSGYTSVDLLVAVEVLGSWDEQTLGNADSLLTIWTARASSRGRDNIVEIDDLLRTLHFILEEYREKKKLPESYVYRWSVLRDVLVSRHRAITYSDPKMTLARGNVSEILEIVNHSDEAMTCQDVKTRLKDRYKINLSIGRVCQLVSTMETDGLVAVSNYKVKSIK